MPLPLLCANSFLPVLLGYAVFHITLADFDFADNISHTGLLTKQPGDNIYFLLQINVADVAADPFNTPPQMNDTVNDIDVQLADIQRAFGNVP